MFAKYAGLVFDMDGTIVESGTLHEDAWIQALREFSIPVDNALMHSLAGVPTEKTVEIVCKHFGILDTTPVASVALRKQSLVQENASRYIRPTRLIALVKRYYKKIPLAVGTGATTEEAHHILERCKLKHMFDCIVGADQVDHAKPSPETFLLCAQKMGVKAEQCLVFEDAPLGIQAATQAGMACINVQKKYNIINRYFL